MNWDKLDEYEKAAYKWQYKMNGHFFTNLWEAIVKADDHNLGRLSLGFPIEVEAYKRYTGRYMWWTNAVKKYRGEEGEAPQKSGAELDAEIAGAHFKESMSGKFHNRTEE